MSNRTTPCSRRSASPWNSESEVIEVAAAETKAKPSAKAKKKQRGRMPTKRDINLAVVGEKKIKIGIAFPAILLILVGAVLFSKFLVIDRLAEVSAAEREVARLQDELDRGYEELADYAELADLYAHYTYSGMTDEEMARVSRVDAMSVIERVVFTKAEVDSWSLSGNQLQLNMSESTLQEINLTVQELNKEPLVDFCTVSTAVRKDPNARDVDEDTIVSAVVIAYLTQVTEEETK